jgi:hypothetical protein
MYAMKDINNHPVKEGDKIQPFIEFILAEELKDEQLVAYAPSLVTVEKRNGKLGFYHMHVGEQYAKWGWIPLEETATSSMMFEIKEKTCDTCPDPARYFYKPTGEYYCEDCLFGAWQNDETPGSFDDFRDYSPDVEPVNFET